MIYTDSQLKEKIVRMIESFENEVVEFKEARTNYSFNDIGKYFSALSNEANLRGLQEAWLIFGISDDKRYVGTEFRKQGSLQSLKKEIVNGTNERLTFLEIYELTMEKCRVIAFQIPPAIRGIPTTWQGAAYAREHESVSPLPMNKVDLLRNQIGMDWSKEIVEDATIEDLDEEAIKRARELFSKRQSDGYSSEYIYRFLRNIFEESINDPEKKAQIFLNRFDFEIGKYKVYFVFYEKLKPYQKLLNERLHKCLGTIQDVFTDTYLLLNKKKKNLKEPGNVDEQSIMLLLENFFIEE